MKTLYFHNDRLVAIDQRLLPLEECYLELRSPQEVVEAIRTMAIRGAPAIAVAAAYAVVLGAIQEKGRLAPNPLEALGPVFKALSQSRPTARNLFHFLGHMERAVSRASGTPEDIISALLAEAKGLHAREVSAEVRLSRLGSKLIPQDSCVLTHCNTGALATGGYGTAAGIIRYAHKHGTRFEVMATETRPLLQGARLTAWELKRLRLPFTLITDSMAGYFIAQGRVSCIVVGADCITRNGDVVNKVGTYTLAVLAQENAVPFYVAAPTSTIDATLPTGSDVPIEERSPEEVTCIHTLRIAPQGVRAANPAFDITPHHFISAIITEKGIYQEPLQLTLGEALE